MRWEYQITWPASGEICMQVKNQQLELVMEQQTGSKSGKESVKTVHCHRTYLIYMQSASWEMLGWMKHKLESWFLGEISVTCRWHHPYGGKWSRTKAPLDESERGEWKSWLKTQHSENLDHGFRSSMANRWGNSGRFYFWGLHNHCRWWLQPWNLKTLTPWKESYDQPR